MPRNNIERITAAIGSSVERLSPGKPLEARRLLLAAFRAYKLKLKFLPGKELPPSKQYLGPISMSCMIRPLAHPDRQVLTSIFTPSELFHAMGLFPMCAEQFATYTNGAGAEHIFVEIAERAGIAETFCSYHKVVIGGAYSGVLPKPLAVVNTSLACDANNLTFRKASELLAAPQYYIDVPYNPSRDAVEYVADQLREMGSWLEDLSGIRIDEGKLKESVQCSQRTIRTLRHIIPYRAQRYVPSELTAELYEVLMTHNALGLPETLKYAQLLLKDFESSKEQPGRKILWMHSNPFYQDVVKKTFNYKSDPWIALTEMCYDELLPSREEDPYMAMAYRTVYNSFNGPVTRRAGKAVRMAKEIGADGVILFCHWGCKETCGGSAAIADALEEAGFPVLILNGDGVDSRNSSDGQVGTRLGAFLEMLGTDSHS